MLELAGLFAAVPCLQLSSRLVGSGFRGSAGCRQGRAWRGAGGATVGNTLGSCVNWAAGRFLAHWQHHPRFPVKPAQFARYEAWYARWGWSLLLSWAPIVGDPLTAIAGVFRTPLWLFVIVVGVAKLARYLVVAGGVWLVT